MSMKTYPTPKATLVVSLGAQAVFADLFLASLQRQTTYDFDVLLIADSAPQDVIRLVQTRLPLLPVKSKLVYSYEMQFAGNEGQRLLSIALRNSASDVLIFTDSDCLPHSHFIEEHLQHSEEHVLLTGKHVLLSESISLSLSSEDILSGKFEDSTYSIFADGIFGQTLYPSRGIYLRHPVLQSLRMRSSRYIYASNFSLLRTDAMRILSIEHARDEYDLVQKAQLDIKVVTNIAVQFRLRTSTDRRLLLANEVLERVLRLRYAVEDYGLQPIGAMIEVKRKKSSINSSINSQIQP
jgi:hypothetical protein